MGTYIFPLETNRLFAITLCTLTDLFGFIKKKTTHGLCIGDSLRRFIVVRFFFKFNHVEE